MPRDEWLLRQQSEVDATRVAALVRWLQGGVLGVASRVCACVPQFEAGSQMG